MKQTKASILYFMGPAMLLFCLIFIYPVSRTAIMSFFSVKSVTSAVSTWSWAGLDNYIKLFHTPLFITSVINIGKIWLYCGIACLGLAIALAIILTSGLRGQKFFRAIIYDFCKNIKAIRGFQYTQVDNVFSRGGTLFSQVGNIWGQDLPSKVQLKISYGDIPVHGGGRALIDRVYRHREEFEDVIVIGCDDCGIEQTFDFSSVLKHLVIQPTKDENEHFNPTEVRDLLLSNLR